jgi:chaperonin cofactor prefoldin|tara:strand:+ start:213 stop:425 length:213 start_codon:yes stop_codon:yes gene_type:complete
MKDVKDDIIKDLELKLDMAEQVKVSEVQFNTDLKDRIEKLELHIETLLKVNEFFRQKVLKYKSIVSKLTK